MVRENFIEKVTFDQRSEGREGVVSRRAFQDKEQEHAETLEWKHLRDAGRTAEEPVGLEQSEQR